MIWAKVGGKGTLKNCSNLHRDHTSSRANEQSCIVEAGKYSHTKNLVKENNNQQVLTSISGAKICWSRFKCWFLPSCSMFHHPLALNIYLKKKLGRFSMQFHVETLDGVWGKGLFLVAKFTKVSTGSDEACSKECFVFHRGRKKISQFITSI